MSTVAEEVVRPFSATGLMGRAVCVKVLLRRPGKTRKVAQEVIVPEEQAANQPALIDGQSAMDGRVETVQLLNARIHTDKDSLRVSKKIIDAPEFEAIEQIDSQIRGFLMKKALPSIFQSGVYLVPIPMIGEIDVVLQNYQASRAELVNAVCLAYGRIREDAKTRLLDLYSAGDYLTEGDLRAQFEMRFEYIGFDVPMTLKEIDAQLFEREKEKTIKRWNDAGDEIMFAVRESMSDLVSHAIDRLSGSTVEGEKPKTFRASTITNIQEFLDSFSSRNIVNDTDLEALVDKAKLLLKGVDPQKLRGAENESIRDSLRSSFQEVKMQLDTMMENRPTRKMHLSAEMGD